MGTPHGGGMPTEDDGRRQVERWLAFALRQEARCAPGGPAAARPGAAPATYSLHISHLESLPHFQAEDRPLDVRLGVTLWDEGAGAFFGPTARTAAVPYDLRRSKGKLGFHVDVDSTLFLRSRAAMAAAAAPPRAPSAGPAAAGSGGLLAVVEVVLVERSDAGVACGEYSAAWCAVPLQLAGGTAAACGGAAPAAAPAPRLAGPAAAAAGCCGVAAQAASPPLRAPQPSSPYSPLSAGAMAARLGAHSALCVPLFLGSPRWLALQRALPPGQCPPPPPLLADGAACRLHYQFEPCPEAERTFGPLLPEDCLLSGRDLLPGVQRQPARPARSGGACGGGGGKAPAGWGSQLEPAGMLPVRAVVLESLVVHLPEGFVELARKQAAGLLCPQQQAGVAAPSGAAVQPLGSRPLPLAGLRRCLALRVSVHNGRRFVGPAVLCPASSLEPLAGRRGQHVLALARGAPIAWLPADAEHVVLVAELLLTHSGSGDGEPGAAKPGGGGGGGERVLAWGAAAPFRSGAGGEALAEGLRQVDLRSGPGRWLRPQPVLDWRRLLERAGHASPQAPRLSFVLQAAPGQAVWPPPPAPLPLWPSQRAARDASPPPPALAAAPAQPSPGLPPLDVAALAGHERHTTASEADTLVSVRQAGGQGSGKAGAGGSTAPSGHKLPAAYGAPQQGVQCWRIEACYQGAAGEGRAAAADAACELHRWQPPPLRAIRTSARGRQSPTGGGAPDAAALYAGSPCAGRRDAPPQPQSAAEAAAAAAAAAQPAAAVAALDASPEDELGDSLVSAAASLQLLGFEAEPGAGSEEAPLPRRMHFTLRFYASPPAASAPLLLEAVGAPAGGGGGGVLHALVSEAGHGAGGGGRPGSRHGAAAGTAPPAPELRLELLDLPALEAAAAEAAEQGAPAAAASLLWQQRLRAAQYLAGRTLQVDAWDSDTGLQVGTLSVPLCCLLRRGLPATAAVLRVPFEDQERGIERLEGSEPAGVQLHSGALRGSLLLRLASRGTPLPPALAQLGGGRPACGARPASPLKHRRGGACLVKAEAESPGQLQSGQAGAELGRREAILRRLQAELPSCVAVCVAPGEAAGFECSFANSSAEEGFFEVDLSAGGAGGGASAAELSLVGSDAGWQALAAQAELARLAVPAQHRSSARAVGSERFRLAPHGRCLLRFKLQLGLGSGDQCLAGRSSGTRSALQWHEVLIRPAGGGSMPPPPAATIRVAVLAQAAPVVSRTLRLYSPAGSSSSSAACVHALALAQLPGGGSSLAEHGQLLLAGSPDAAAVLRHGHLLLSCPPPAAGTSTRLLLAAAPGGAVPAECWEVFVHGAPALRLAAGVGGAAGASVPLPGLGAAAGELSCHWRGCSGGELQASLGSAAAAGGGRGGGGRLALRYEPAMVARRELLLSLAAGGGPACGCPTGGASLLLLALDSRATPPPSRSFEVEVPAGQAVSKRVRYRSAHSEPRRFALWLPGRGAGGAPPLLRVARPTFGLAGGAEAAIRLTFDATAAAAGQRQELLVVLESEPTTSGDSGAGGGRGSGDSSSSGGGGGGRVVEELFRVLVAVA